MKKIFFAMAFSILMLSSLTVFAQSREDLLRDIAAKRAELAKLEKTFLSAPEEDRAKYAEFLRSPDTGMFRLLPADTYAAYGNREPQLTVSGNGVYYSFKEHTHEYGQSAALSLGQGEFRTGFAGANYGIIVRLGDVPLESVTLETGATQVLAQHKAALEEPQARIEQRKVSEGVSLDGITYKNRAPVVLDSTYVLRSVIYHASDLLVAFRVVRIDNDDSVVIVWKQLKKYPTPYLARN